MVKRFQYQAMTPGWYHWGAEDDKASAMTWYIPPRDMLHRPPPRRAAAYLPCLFWPIDFTPPAPTTAQLMAWFTPTSQPRIVRKMERCLTVSYPTPLQPNYGGALLADIQMVNSIGDQRIEASGTVVAGRGIGTIP
jgi:hypothetical protein